MRSYDEGDPSGDRMARRRALRYAAASAGTGSLFASSLLHGEAVPLGGPESMTLQGAGVRAESYGEPSRFESGVVRRGTDVTPTATSSWSFTPWQAISGTITPNGLFFERHHGGIPDIVPEQHRLVVHGQVERALMYSMNDILRMPAVSRIHFLECSGNGYSEWRKPTAGSVQFSHGLLSCCEWTGVPLSVVLAESGVRPGGKWLLAEGADASGMTRSIPLDLAMSDGLLAYAQNGERLRPEQGYPLRLLMPGLEGNMSVKWLRRLKVGDLPFQTREETSKYSDLMPDGTARQFTFVMEAKSVITRPSGGMVLPSHGFHEVSGIAWSGRGRIRNVDVSVDAGRTWHAAHLDGPVLNKALTRFRLPWRWDGQRALLQSRATDETGYVQPTLARLVAVRGENSVYHNNAIQTWEVLPSGEIRNVHA